MRADNHPVVLTLLTSVVVGIAGFISASTGFPTAAQPISLAVAIPALYIADFFYLNLDMDSLWQTPLLTLSCLPVVCAFLLWSLHLFRASAVVPARSVVLFLILVLLVAADLGWCWSSGVEYQGLRFTVLMIVWNSAFVTMLALTLIRARCSPSFLRNLLFHGILFVWIAWCAFPWLGELL